jgi:hypothetical protein
MAAGLGFKTFTTGEVLTAADTNGYLMQGINVFASTAARDAAITSPQEGQFAYTKDTNSLWYYTGSAWAASGATGDIEGVTAGIGISGGGTSGTVTVTNSMATAIDAKGDLIAGTAADTFDRLAVGTNGQTLVADSTASTGLKWATPAGGGGKVLQVVNATTTTATSNATTTYADTTLTATITPTLATSKILVLIAQQVSKNSNNAANATNMATFRDATKIVEHQDIGYTGTAIFTVDMYSINYLDSPATTSATTYKTQFRNSVASTNVTVQSNNSISSITLMEIGA